MTHLKINNKIDKPLWKKIPCNCSHDGDITHDFPIHECLHCHFEHCENSCPTESFILNEPVLDKDGKPTGQTKQREITEITLVNGNRYGDLIGWTF